MSDLMLKEIYGIYETKNLTKEQINKYKMNEREIFEKYDNLSEDKLDTKVMKTFMSKMMLWLLLLNVAEVKKKETKQK